jgi:hypothetical protein
MTKYITCVLVTAALAAGCTMSNTEAPPLAGPSEMSLSLAITANPDVLSLDGSSQTLVTVEARDTNAQPAANVPLRVEILADGQSVDFGGMSLHASEPGWQVGIASARKPKPPTTAASSSWQMRIHPRREPMKGGRSRSISGAQRYLKP